MGSEVRIEGLDWDLSCRELHALSEALKGREQL